MKIAQALQSGSVLDRTLSFLDRQPDDEILTTAEVEVGIKCAFLESGGFKRARRFWVDYHQKLVVDGQLQYVWGNKRAIANLRQQLFKPEATNENQ